MKCIECPDYTKCVKESNLAIKRKNCPKAKKEKVKTNADRIRSMNDEELARFVATKIVNIENNKMVEQGYTPTATQLVELAETMYVLLIRWFRQPAEEDTP